MKQIIQNTLKEHRLKAGLTQAQVAEYLGLKSTDRISKWEHGLKYPHVRNLLKIAELYNIHPNELYLKT